MDKKQNTEIQSLLLSDDLLEKIRAGKLWTFHGGVHAPDNKAQSSHFVIKDAGIPPYLIINTEHKGEAAQPLVSVGDSVLKGQPLTKATGAFVVQHASSSGKVIAIEPRTDLHPSGLAVVSIIIETDGLDRSINFKEKASPNELSRKEIIEATQQAGIIGLGGAGFPTHVKLARAQDIKLLIVNGAECEPYITSDDRLMQEYAHEILQGIEVAQQALHPQLTVIAIEDNKLDAIEALNQAIKTENKTDILVRKIPTMYPSGSAKQLIKILTGRQTPIGKHANALGIV
ncbi:MAG TPA: RnfABCDGE type electron transport complex subunit C, partial [Psychromonas hadalis]|nr:RnfABCDGE type electron transport complex subunit C [Psychromonas hadalis]